jgi:hypothetical protein
MKKRTSWLLRLLNWLFPVKPKYIRPKLCQCSGPNGCGNVHYRAVIEE